MNHRIISTVVLMSFLVVTSANLLILSISDKSINPNIVETFFFMKSAYAQSPDLGADNSTDLVIPFDNSTDLGIPQDNSTSDQNQTSSATTPEFGSIAPIVLVISIISIVILSLKTKLGFN